MNNFISIFNSVQNGYQMENDSHPHLSPDLLFSLQIKMPRCEMGLLNSFFPLDGGGEGVELLDEGEHDPPVDERVPQLPRADILVLKHACSILRQSSNPVCDFSMTEQVRLCAVQGDPSGGEPGLG